MTSTILALLSAISLANPAIPALALATGISSQDFKSTSAGSIANGDSRTSATSSAHGTTGKFSSAATSWDEPAGGLGNPSSSNISSESTPTAIPEPAAAVFGSIGMFFLLRRRR